MKKLQILGFVVSGCCFVAGQAAVAACSMDSVALRGDWGQARFNIELADDAAERAQGLMHVETMPTSSGMLFVYPEPQSAGFWMKNTLIALDMIFVDQSGLVTRIHENAIPHDTSVIDGGDDVLMVLEINGGMASALGISVGSAVQFALFDQNISVWPCEQP